MLLIASQEKSTIYDRSLKWIKQINDKKEQFIIDREKKMTSPERKSRVSSP